MGPECDLFFSYRRQDLERASPLLEALDAAGVRVWRDQTALPDFAPITPEIRHAIATSRALLAFYSWDYPLSRACFKELSTLWMAAQQAGALPYSRELVLNPETGFDHMPPVLREQQSIRWPQDPSRFAELAARIRDQVAPLTERCTKPRPRHHRNTIPPRSSRLHVSSAGCVNCGICTGT